MPRYERSLAVAATLSFVITLGLRAQGPVDPAEAQRLVDVALNQFAQAEYREALQSFDAAIPTADGQISLRARKGKVRSALRLAEFDLAVREARALVAVDARDDESRALSGDALWAGGLFDEAEGAYTHALTLNERSARARFGVARSLATRSQLTEALAGARAALVDAPEDAELHALAGLVYERLLRFDEAADEYAAYASLVPPQETTPAATARARAVFLRSFRGRVPLEVSSKDRTRPHTMPFKLVQNKVMVQGRLNGTPVEWVLDTGAERIGVSYALASRARLRAVATTLTAGVGRASLRRVQLARADSLEVGSLRLRQVPVSVRNPAADGAQRWQSESLSPLALGLSAVIDYRARRVTLAYELPDAPSSVRLPLRVHRLPFVRGMLNATHPAYFVVDTGGEVISISADVAGTLGMTPSRRIPLRVIGMSGPDDQAFLLPGIDLDFSEIAYRKIGLAVLNLRAPSVLLGFQVGGIVGHKFLGGYRVSMDVGRSELRLE